jgi:tetratricopeptide (TPR) repeat protein
MAAQVRNDVAKIIEYGDLLLDVSPNNLGAMLTLGTVYMENLPTTEPARGRALAEAYDLANRARVQAQQYFAGNTSTTAERTQVEITIHTIFARVHYARSDYQRAADEYLQVVSLAPTDSDAYYRLGDSYQYLAVAASREVEATLAARTVAGEQGRDEGTLEQLERRYEGLQANVLAYLDRSIDFFATATALGGSIAPEARQRLESLYRNRNEDSLEGLEELIRSKQEALRAP